MRRCLASLLIVVLAVLALQEQASGASQGGGYFHLPSARLMLKLPGGTWKVVSAPKEAPAIFAPLLAAAKPAAILAASDKEAVIAVWVKHSYRDYSNRRVTAFAVLERMLRQRREAAVATYYRYFTYDFQDEPIKATAELEAEVAGKRIHGQGRGMFFFRDGDSYFSYIEVLAESGAFAAIKEEFDRAIGATYVY